MRWLSTTPCSNCYQIPQDCWVDVQNGCLRKEDLKRVLDSIGIDFVRPGLSKVDCFSKAHCSFEVLPDLCLRVDYFVLNSTRATLSRFKRRSADEVRDPYPMSSFLVTLLLLRPEIEESRTVKRMIKRFVHLGANTLKMVCRKFF